MRHIDKRMTLPRLAITMGDPAGVGPELCVRALQHEAVLDVCQPIVFGDLSVLERVAEALNVTLKVAVQRPIRPLPHQSCIVDFAADDLAGLQPGVVSAATGAAAARYIEAATEAALNGEVAGIVTCPIHKEAFHAAGVPYPGHTEMLAELTQCQDYCMMLTSREITCALVTTHLGLCDVPSHLSTESVLRVIRLTDACLTKLRRRRPRLVVCGLNPHAGEHGLFGRGEEEQIILPAVQTAIGEGIDVVGPLSPDTAFVPRVRAATDAYVCMYHDQGLIPLKALAFDTAINVTVGLPILRASVDHGTALDIAWQGKVEISSFLEAVRWIAASG